MNCQYALLLLVLLLLRTNKQNSSTVCTNRANVYVGIVHVLVMSVVRLFTCMDGERKRTKETPISNTKIHIYYIVIVVTYLLMCCYSLSSAWLER